MSDIFIYLVKSSISLVVLYSGYYFFFRRDKYFAFCRFYLLGAILISLTLPLNQIEMSLSENKVLNESIINLSEKVTNIESTFQHSDNPASFKDNPSDNSFKKPIRIALIVYGIGFVILTLRFIIHLLRIFRTISKNQVLKIDDFNYVLIDKEINPHSFFNYIFINKDEYQTQRSEYHFIEHEKAHIKQMHSVDILFIELLQIIFWFNPVVLLFKRSLRIIHEYLADNSVLERFPDVAYYQEKLFSKAYWNNTLNLANTFNSSIVIKKRLAMMTIEKSKNFTWLKLIILIPLMIILICGINLRVTSKNILNGNISFGLEEKLDYEFENTVLSNEPLRDVNPSIPVAIMKEDNLPVANDKQPHAVITEERLIKGSVKDAKTNEPLPGVSVIIKDTNKGTITDISGNFVIKVDSSHNVLCFHFRGYNTVYMIITEYDKMDVLMAETDINSTQQIEKPGAAHGFVVVSDSLRNPLWVFDTSTVNRPKVFVIDNIQVGFSEFLNLDPNEIESIRTIASANQDCIKLYGKEAENGVIIIKTKAKENNKK